MEMRTLPQNNVRNHQPGERHRDLDCAADQEKVQEESKGASSAWARLARSMTQNKLRSLRTGKSQGEGAASAHFPDRGTFHDINTSLQPSKAEGSCFSNFHPHPSPSLSDRADIPDGLPAPPENAHIRPRRVPASTELIYSRTREPVLQECCTPPQHQPARPAFRKMAFSKSQRIIILLVIDTIFFLIELVSGYAVHSLALVADSFHMLNDIVSLMVGLWAVKQAKTGRSANYTYGWQRAETIGALFNGVFLIALCLSIFLDAIQRFVEPQIVTNPQLVLIVGCLGLASNLFGLVLFHDHGHAHDGGEDEHSHAEEGRSEAVPDETTRLLSDERGSVEDTLPTVRVAGYQGTPKRKFSKSDESSSTAADAIGFKRKSVSVDKSHKRRASFFTGSIDDMPIHPAGRRDEIISAARYEDDDQSDTNSDEAVDADGDHGHKHNGKSTDYGTTKSNGGPAYSHAAHKHRQPKDQTKSSSGHGHGHSHGDLNMRGVFLHVLGDALGNIGVIATALIIWLTHFPGRYYFDPGISLVITCIILWSAIPLCKAASRILLQAVPPGMDVDEIRTDIEDLQGVVSAHHLHVWQLSDTKLVASLHVRISSEIKNTGTEGYMRLAREIQQCLKEYGIRSSTIQPEFEIEDAHSEHHHDHADHPHSPHPSAKKTASLGSKDADECMLDSEDAGAAVVKTKSHDHDHDHSDHDGHAHNHGNGKKHNHQH